MQIKLKRNGLMIQGLRFMCVVCEHDDAFEE